jgi:uncharacterized membrane protein YhaH (DUF805 family)
MSSPTPGYDPNDPQGNQPGWGAPQPPGYPSSGYSPAPSYSGGAAPAPSMGMADAVRIVLTKYADFSGRARRSEYWWFFLANFIVSIVAAILDQAVGFPLLQIVLGLALLIPGIAVGVRRLHDTGRSGWWLLIAFVPFVGVIILVVLLCLDGQPGPNNYGPSPKYAVATGY